MVATWDFEKLVQRRIARDPDFRDALLREGIDTMGLSPQVGRV